MILENAKIKELKVKSIKDKETKELIIITLFKIESEINNSNYISGIFIGFRKQLNNITFTQSTAEFTEIKNVHVEKFNVKNKMAIVGSGKDTERIPIEILEIFLTVKDEDGVYLAELQKIFDVSCDLEFEAD